MAGGLESQKTNQSSGVKETALRVLSACVIGSVLALVVPKILGDEYATRKVARVVAPLVGAFYREEARTDDITVLLVDDRSIDEAGEPWPPSYDYYAKLLADIAPFSPRAVFIDLIFSSVRKDADVQGLRQVLDEMKRKHIDVYLAAALDEDGNLSLRKELEGAATKVAVEYSPDELDRVVWEYPMTRFRGGEDEVSNAGEHEAHRPPRSAALAIFEDTYHNKVRDTEEPLALTWGLVPVLDGLQWTRLNPESTREAADKEPGQADTVSEKRYESYCNDGQRAAGLLLRAIPHAFVPASGKPACVFHHTLYARELLYPDATRNGRFNDSLSHKVVMIGSSFAYSNDLVFSPIHERIPGVYLHAMALDNLLTGGPEYTKAVELGLKGDSEHVRALGLVFFGLLGVALVSVLKERFLEVREKRHAHARGPHRAEPMVDEATIATIGLATGATPGSSEALATYPAAQVQVVVQIAVEPARRPSSTWTDRALVKAKDACQWIFLKTMEIVLSLVIVGVLLYVGQAVLNVAYLSAVHVALFSLVSEWLEWNRKLVDWLHAPEEDMS